MRKIPDRLQPTRDSVSPDLEERQQESAQPFERIAHIVPRPTLPERRLADRTALPLINDYDATVDVIPAYEMIFLADLPAFDVLLLAVNGTDSFSHRALLPVLGTGTHVQLHGL